jgi:hypothetical protein
MKTRTCFITAALLLIPAALALADSAGRIYGKITTVDGDILEGPIRWDKNEASWVDILNGTKELPDRNFRSDRDNERRRYSDRGNSRIRFFGITIGDEGNSDWSNSASTGIRMGHIRTLEVLDDDRALLILKSGKEVEFENSSTDIGSGIREIVIEDRRTGEIELVWDDIEKIDFMDTPKNTESNFGDRLYGTLTTRRGDTFTGFVCWDVDELFGSDILDGEDGRRTTKLAFEKIATIERYSSKAAKVILKSGDELVLRGSNDVDDSNRGILVSDPGFGEVTVQWREFEKLEFGSPKATPGYSDFNGGQPIYGTVYTGDGDKHTGRIRWDNDEEYTWEILDGDYHDISFDIEFGSIKDITRRGYRGSLVTTWDGRSFHLRDSNDVDDDNKGIYVTTDDGSEFVVEWDELDHVEFARK